MTSDRLDLTLVTNGGKMSAQQSSTDLRASGAISDINRISRRRGTLDRDLDVEAAALSGLLRQAVDAPNTPARLQRSIELYSRSAHQNEFGVPRQDFAAVLRMLLNTEGVPEDLGKRRDEFKVPASIATAYGIAVTSTSRFRTIVCRDAVRDYVDALVAMSSRVSTPRAPAEVSPIEQISRLLPRMIGAHGYNDADWTTALSSQYFLFLLARRLQDENRQDVIELTNTFLSSFTPRADDTIALNEQHVLVTPDELRRMEALMVEEDQTDSYFASRDKTRVERIDFRQLHLNYLYGLIVGITATSTIRTMATVREIALSHLLDGNSAALDASGGWTPYRIPWITARILLSLRELPPDLLDENTLNLVDQACESLLARMQSDCTWRSGVGTWVSLWESTGLCLEALAAWSERLDQDRVSEIGAALLTRRGEWLGEPGFDSEEKSNATLAACVLASTLVRYADSDSDTQGEMLRYLAAAMVMADETRTQETRQFCTVPQVVYYAAKGADRASTAQ